VAQTLEIRQKSVPQAQMSCKNLAVAVPTAGNTVLLEVPVSGTGILFATFKNTGFLFDAFIVEVRPHRDAPYVTLFSLAADYTTPKSPLLNASGDLTILANGSTGWLYMLTEGFESVRFSASANGTATAVDAYAGAN
jgi:hypothetical protein